MKIVTWKELQHKASPEQREALKRKAVEEFDRANAATAPKLIKPNP